MNITLIPIVKFYKSRSVLNTVEAYLYTTVIFNTNQIFRETLIKLKPLNGRVELILLSVVLSCINHHLLIATYHCNKVYIY